MPSPRGADSTARFRRTLNTRSVVLASVVVVSLLALLVPLRELFAIRGDVAAISAQNAELTAVIDELEQQKRALADPDVLAREAREELYRVPEGWKLYVVLDPTDEEQKKVDEQQREARTGTGTWYERMFGSLRWADGSEAAGSEAAGSEAAGSEAAGAEGAAEGGSDAGGSEAKSAADQRESAG